MSNPALTVYFRSFPEDTLDEDLYNLFSEYGEIVKFFIHKNRSYGMVQYQELSSCTNVIQNLQGKPPLNLYLNMAKYNKSVNENKKSIAKLVNHTDYQPIYYEEEYYVDENEFVIPILNDPITNTIFVPLKYAPTIKRRVRKIPYSAALQNGDLSDDNDNCSISTSSSSIRKVVDSDFLNLRVERSFADDSKPSPRTVKQLKNSGSDNNNFRKKSNQSSSQTSGSGDENKPHFGKRSPNNNINKHKTSNDDENKYSIKTSTPNNNFETKKPAYNIVQLPQNKFTAVQVVHVLDDYSGWIQICDNYELFVDLMAKILNYTKTRPKSCKPEVGKMCLAKFEESWFRAIILTATKHVHFIDYGNDCKVNEDLLEIPTDLKDIHAFAIHINLLDGSPSKIRDGAILKIKPIITENDVVKVQVENGIYDRENQEPISMNVTENPTSSIKPAISQKAKTDPIPNALIACQKSMMSSLEQNTVGFISLTLKISPTIGVGYFLPHNLADHVSKLENISTDLKDLPFVEPKIGDLVAAENDSWKRALILDTKDGYKVAFIDFGIIEVVPEVKPLPDIYKNIPQFTCCFSNNDLEKFQLNAVYDFTITNIVNNTVHCKIEVEDNMCDIMFTLWNPTIENDILPLNLSNPSNSASVPIYLKLKNGENVKVIEEKDGYLYVRTKEGSKILTKIENYISASINKASKLTTEPIVGQLVLAQFEDTWHRAIITNVKKNLAEILYIDYGNEEIKPFFSLKLLDEQMKQEPVTLIKIKLRGFTDKSFSTKCLNYFEALTENCPLLRATFQGSVENGVDLITKNGKNINDELKKLDAIPSLFKNKELHMKITPPGLHDPREMNLQMFNIPLGKQEIKYLCDVNLSTYSICICLNQPELLHMVHVELKSQMTKYVENIVPNQSYIPIPEELILVEHDTKWYRAFCLEHNENGFNVFFVDYGFHEFVPEERIRKMPKEFIHGYNALGNFAVMQGLPDNPAPKLIDRLKSLLVENEIYQVEILNKDDDDNYHVIFPDLLKQLQKERLI